MFKRIADGFTVFCVVVFNAGLLFLLVNIAVYWAHPQADPYDPDMHRAGWLAKHGIEPMRRVYPGLSDAEIDQLLRKTQRFGVLFEPYIQLKSEPSVVEHTAFHPAGFRLIGRDQGPWPIDGEVINVFVFGGSTAVGSGVRDDHTIPAALQRHLRERTGRTDINVYNFATASHYSTQERIYFEQLLLHDTRPDIAVFVDGLNDFYFWDDRPSHTQTLQNAFTSIHELTNPRGLRGAIYLLLHRLPITNYIRDLQRRSGEGEMPRALLIGSAHAADNALADPSKINAVISRYLNNKAIIEAVAGRFEVQPLLVWQPVPLYKFPAQQRLFPVTDEHGRHEFGYPMMRAEIDKRADDRNFLWCADVLGNAQQPMYIDAVHYTIEANDIVAKCIANAMLERHVLAGALAPKAHGTSVAKARSLTPPQR